MPQIDEENSQKEKLDKKDHDIIDLLRNDARLTYQQIAKKIGLSHDAISYRIKRLEKLEVISKYASTLNYADLGYNEYHMLFQHIENKPKKTEDFYKYLKNHKKIKQVILYSDKWDVQIIILAKNSLELDEIITNINNRFSDIIKDQQILEKVRDCTEGSIGSKVNKVENMKLDKHDKTIIDLLLENSRISLVDISKKVPLSADAIMYRLRKYREHNLIKKHTVQTNATKMGYHWYSVILVMKVFGTEEEEKLRDLFNSSPELIDIIKTIGEWNIVLTVLAKDPREFHKKITDIKHILGESLKDYDALLAYKEIKNKDIKI